MKPSLRSTAQPRRCWLCLLRSTVTPRVYRIHIFGIIQLGQVGPRQRGKTINKPIVKVNQFCRACFQDSSRASSFAQHLRVRFKCWRDLRKEAAGDCWSAVEQLKQRETSLIKACHKNQARMDWMRAVMNLPLQCAILLCQHQLQQQSSHRGCP